MAMNEHVALDNVYDSGMYMYMYMGSVQDNTISQTPALINTFQAD